MSPIESYNRLDDVLGKIVTLHGEVFDDLISGKPFLVKAAKLREASQDLMELAMIWHGAKND
jgi:hypothetical protein